VSGPAGAADFGGWLPAVERLAREAGALILQVYAGDFAVRGKADASPVTEADERAEACITAGLRALAPAVPVVAEEAVARGDVPAIGERFWLVDPLDGTREFVQRNGEFTVNIALIEHALPVLGVVFVPATGVLYAGLVGQGAWVEAHGVRRAIASTAVPAVPSQGLRLACSRSHGDEAALQAWLAGGQVAERITAGSSLKFGLVAEGRADVYPRLGRTMEWDTAAGHAVLRAAGGEVRELQGAVLRYGKPGFENPHFVAWGRT
jgi:3'(2'), 5'-bisphosphate nucleotidase